ncbi:acylphosphatase [Chitinivorax sp. B]|uniref:acylphosphatase n=1 Tax=Chitinivorax sp. B TaxID=2502235 RepID=UPI0010F8863F|nr:acylphosphatase [Chitinivorax sp. B]
MNKAVRVTIHGKVQGVGFRYATCRQAGVIGVDGWVRNLLGGQVEAMIQGDGEAVDALLAWCHRGPPGALVSRVEVEEAMAEDLRGFEQRGTA